MLEGQTTGICHTRNQETWGEFLIELGLDGWQKSPIISCPCILIPGSVILRLLPLGDGDTPHSLNPC